VSARRFFAALAVAVLPACSVVPQAPDGVLESRIWDVRAGTFIGEEQLVQRLRMVRYRLLGEVHDHPVHHALRATLIRKSAAPGPATEIFFEQFDLENDAALRAAQARGANADELSAAGKLAAGWKWPLHKPLLEAALAAGHPVRAANLSRTEASRIVAAGALRAEDAVLAAAIARANWSAERDRALREEMFESHCRKLPEHLAPAMALAQRARDAAMALALAGAPGNAVLVAGNGHVRLDKGVPLYLPPGASLASVGFVETRPGEADPREYTRGRNGEHAYDYVWFTSPQARPDPCEALKKR
jgi:uncharacterized iron-regulated protein